MKVHTMRFGEIDISEDKVLVFENGIPPFNECTKYTLICSEETDPFLWLQSLDDADLALAVVNPFRLFPDYAPSASDEVLGTIGNPPYEDILVLTVAVISSNYREMSTNLVSPILINPHTNQSRQIIMENSPYATKQPIYDRIEALVIGGEINVGSNPED
ncbi:MAG: flagellar assembly protein FliW [Oscillospiraceae bacterium]|nr:flagellar assembly protein FliW [Oscillospiraceae bacterium]